VKLHEKDERKKLYVQNVGYVKLKHGKTEIQGKIKTVTLRREAEKWYACFSCDNVPAKPYPEATGEVGIDVGINNLLATSKSDGTEGFVDNPRWYREAEEKLAEAQQVLSSRKRGTSSRRKAKRRVSRVHTKIRNKRNDFYHKLSRQIVVENKLIAVENLKVKDMVESGSRGMPKSILDAGWGKFFTFLEYKAEEAGRRYVRVPPRNTTSTCSRCGKVKKKTRSEQVHNCPCGLVLDRDLNAARNILTLGLSVGA
jgi:putative transposase